MPPRAPEHAAFRDLNIFEERLRETAASLQRRKHRYQLFLAQLLVVIILLLIEVLLPPDISILSIPYKALLCWLLPEVYSDNSVVILHPYFTTGLLFVSVTTLALFFASGTYSEKIAYANKYVPHTNRALRSFNMFFNTRQPPLRAKFLHNPLSFLFARPDNQITNPTSPPTSRSPSPPPPPPPPSSSSSSEESSRTRSQPGSRPIHSIPPARNPRGEIIFSRRVAKEYQEGYDRYRATFEKKRDEAIRQIKQQKSFERWWWLYKLRFWAPPPSSSASSSSTTTTPTTTPNLPTHPTFSRTSSSSTRGRPFGGGGGGGGTSSRSGTPPTPGSSKSISENRSGSPMRQSRSSAKRSSNRRTPSNSSSSTRRDVTDEGDMRMQTLSRSLAQGSLASS